MISANLRNGDTWQYFAHCASLCLILALAVVKAPIIHDLCATYRGSLNGAVLASGKCRMFSYRTGVKTIQFLVLTSVTHLFLWIVLWLGLTAKRRWTFKLPPLQIVNEKKPLLMSARISARPSLNQNLTSEGTIYWPKLAPISPKLKVTFNEVPSSDDNLVEHDGKR